MSSLHACSKLKQRSLFTGPELMSTSSIDAEVKEGISLKDKSDTVTFVSHEHEELKIHFCFHKNVYWEFRKLCEHLK